MQEQLTRAIVALMLVVTAGCSSEGTGTTGNSGCTTAGSDSAQS